MNEARPVASSMTLDRFYFDECTFVRRSENVGDEKGLEYSVNFTREIEKIDDSSYRVSLRFNAVEKQNSSIEIHIRAVGEFSVDAVDAKAKRILITQNTMAIMFPYIRSQLILLTSQIGCPPINLPILNVAAMFPEVDLPGENEIE